MIKTLILIVLFLDCSVNNIASLKDFAYCMYPIDALHHALK